MRRVKHTLRGSTLMETLVVMLVAGIVFLAAMAQLWIWMLYLMNYVIKQVMILRSNARTRL